jgi:hypothetical protein
MYLGVAETQYEHVTYRRQDKLYASTNAVGVVSELLLAVLNTNVKNVSPP